MEIAPGIAPFPSAELLNGSIDQLIPARDSIDHIIRLVVGARTDKANELALAVYNGIVGSGIGASCSGPCESTIGRVGLYRTGEFLEYSRLVVGKGESAQAAMTVFACAACGEKKNSKHVLSFGRPAAGGELCFPLFYTFLCGQCGHSAEFRVEFFSRQGEVKSISSLFEEIVDGKRVMKEPVDACAIKLTGPGSCPVVSVLSQKSG